MGVDETCQEFEVCLSFKRTSRHHRRRAAEVSRIKQTFGGGTTDHVLRDAKGIAVWVMG